MRNTTFALALLLPLTQLAACGDDPALPAASDARDAAAERTGGTPGDAVRITQDGQNMWQVAVTMPNDATVEVLLFEGSGELYQIKDAAGPFDYTLDPLPGQLTYVEARDVAFGVVDGTQSIWLVRYDGGPYFYEFYIEDGDTQLWEVKLWAKDGEVFATDPVDAAD